MTREAELFSLARDAFRATLPREAEARAAARRIERKLRARRRKRRFAPLLSVAFALVGALAYAAQAARSFDTPEPAPKLGAPVHETPPRVADERASNATTSAPPPSNAPPANVSGSEAPRVTATKPSPKLAAPAREPATWSAVARALASGDEASARKALERLGASGPPRDRANAALELSRLAAHRNDCARARNYLERARAILVSSPSLGRAEEAVKRCDARAAPPANVTD